jgi:hypothetical protein
MNSLAILDLVWGGGERIESSIIPFVDLDFKSGIYYLFYNKLIIHPLPNTLSWRSA